MLDWQCAICVDFLWPSICRGGGAKCRTPSRSISRCRCSGVALCRSRNADNNYFNMCDWLAWMTDCQTDELTEGWMDGRRSQGNANAKTSSQIVIVMIFIIIMRVDQNRDAANNISVSSPASFFRNSQGVFRVLAEALIVLEKDKIFVYKILGQFEFR